jgi:hypothetical protein
MRASLDLPDELLHAVEVHARQAGREIADAVADLLRKGLALSALGKSGNAVRIETDEATGLPIIVGAPCPPAASMTIEELLKLEQATQTQEDLGGLGLPL